MKLLNRHHRSSACYPVAAGIALLLVAGPGPARAQTTAYSLDELVQTGLSTNPGLQAAGFAAAARKASYQASRRLFNPSFEFVTGRAESHDGSESRSTGGISLEQYLENPLKRHYRIRMSESEWQAAEEALRRERLDVAFRIKEHYFRILQMEAKADLASRNLESLQETHRLIVTRVELGEARELEAIRLRVETLRAENEVNAIRSRLELERRHLNAFLGDFLPADYELEGALAYRPIAVTEAELTERALRQHPALRQAEMERELARSRLSFARSGRLPDPLLSGFVEDELDGRNRGIGISIEIPLWDFRGREIAESQSLVDMRERALAAVRMDLTIEVALKLSEFQVAGRSIELFLSDLFDQAEQSLRIAEVSYTQGESSLVDYLDSQRTYFSILNDYQDALFSWNLSRAALERAIGEDLE